MSAKRKFANLLLRDLGLYKFQGTAPYRILREALDEMDFQRLRSSHPCESFDDRNEFYSHIYKTLVGGVPIDYLEFGVYRGESIRQWSTLSHNKCSRFFGFDSFEGLPESWRSTQGRGHFNTNGNFPQIDDSRVHFIKGWFDTTVPEFARRFDGRNKLILHLDADLYSSTMIPLVHLAPFMRAGTLLIFDEFYDRQHEFKAMSDFQRIFRKNIRVAACVGNYAKVCIEIQ